MSSLNGTTVRVPCLANFEVKYRPKNPEAPKTVAVYPVLEDLPPGPMTWLTLPVLVMLMSDSKIDVYTLLAPKGLLIGFTDTLNILYINGVW